jgi:hypothetical protein
LEKGKIDIAGNTRLILGSESQNTIFLFPLFPSRQLFLVPKKNWDDVNLLLSLYNFFDETARIMMLLTLLVVPALVYFLSGMKNQKKRGLNSLTKNYIDGIGIITLVSIKLPQNWPSRWVIGSYALVWLTLSNVYASKMIEFLNTSGGLNDIKNMDELIESNLIIKIPTAMAMLYKQDNRETASKWYNFMHECYKQNIASQQKGERYALPDEFNFAEMILTKKFAITVSDNFAFRVLRMFYDNKGRDLITSVDTKTELFYAPFLPRTSPFVERFNDILIRILEAGITNYQTRLAEIDSNLLYIQRAKNGHLWLDLPQAISFTQLAYIFYYYIGAITVCFCVFILEIFFHSISVIFS